ncbi:hypothetical protein [Aggregatibacter actinomycetemcomitans]|uniref:hypothetical protein n=1 Tax=Aggregatibacter actinomycetemcomitans TaxID=714 RepID=UPI00024001CB|nr:hypothetical protein [Aggregatibacter actinomycetemcomitans]EHK90238.1 hypothetical protein RHAA1_05663 [Aggregatibacter actinomycetemcomitans RhAA1]KNE77308.1 hypothetical protein RHAA2_05775 [Aggregatibacter actinomycetemcomitans RhAA1]
MNNIKHFLIYLLHHEVTLFKHAKITYLLNILRVVIILIVSFGTVFFAVFGLLAFFLIEFTPDMSASEIIITLKTTAYPMSLLLAILETVMRQAYRFLNYCRSQWNIHNAIGVNHE